MPLIELDRVAKSDDLGHEQVPALRDIDVAVEPGEFLAIVGQSGSGRSTLMNCLDVPSAAGACRGG